jgi:Bacterial membrane protein YfhO
MILEWAKKIVGHQLRDELENRKSIFLILLAFAFFFLPWLVAGKTMYPIAEGRSIQFFNDQPTVKTAIFNPIYLDHGATDWIESPINMAAHHAIFEGSLPIWNPYNSMGMPIISNTNGSTMAPLGLFLNFVNSELAWNLMYVGRLLFAVLFTFYFLRKLKLGQIASVSGALLFGFSGYSQLYLNMFHFHVDAILPFLFWATLRYSQEKTKASWVMLLSAISAMILGGNPQNLVLSCIVTCAFFVYLSVADSSKAKYKTGFFYALAFIVATGICSAYGLSFYELYARSLKYHDGVGTFSLPTMSLLGLSFPVFFVTPAQGAVYFPYLGFLTIPVILVGIKFTGQHKVATWFFLVVSLLFILKVVGFPLLNSIGSLPLLDKILFTKYLSPLYFSIAVLFAISINGLLNDRKSDRFYLFVLISFVLMFVLYKYAFHAQHPDRGFLNGWTLLLVFSACMAPLLKRRFSDKKMGFVVAILTCLFCELFFNRTYHVKDALAFGVAFRSPKFVSFIQTDRQYHYDRIFGVGNILMGNLASLYQLHDIRGLSATTDNKYYTFMRDLVLGNKIDLHPFVTTSSTYHETGRSLLNLLGVKYIIFDDCKTHQIESATLVHQELCLEVHKNSAAFDRVFVVHNYVELDSESDILKAMGSGQVDLSKTVVLKKGDHKNLLPPPGEVDSTLINEVAKIESYKTNEISISVNMKAAGILVLSDLFFPGWYVDVDGKEKELLLVDYILRGVALESGQHNIKFFYRPSFLILGGAISFVFLVLVVLVYVFICSADAKRSKISV